MKINKLFWIFALALVLSSASAFAFELSDILKIHRHPIFIFIVNSLIIWSILFLIQASLLKNQDAKVKLVVWIATFALTALIVWNFTPRGAAYFWEVGLFAQYFKFWIIVNTIIFSLMVHLVAGFLDVKLTTPSGKITMVVVAIVLGALMASNLGDKKIWDTDNGKYIYRYLLVERYEETQPDGTKITVGGILTLSKDNVFESRLFIFLISSILFAWFFNSYLGLGQQNTKLTYLMAFIMGANLAKYGTTSSTIIGLGEAFAILIVGQQVMHTWGGQKLVAYFISIILVEWIFCAVFNQSRLLLFVGGLLSQLLQNKVVYGLIALFFAYHAMRAGPKAAIGVLVGLAGIGYLNEKLSGYLSDTVTGLLQIDICKILSQHKIISSASTATGKVAGAIGGTINYAGWIPPDALPWFQAGSLLVTLIGPFIAYNLLKNRI